MSLKVLKLTNQERLQVLHPGCQRTRRSYCSALSFPGNFQKATSLYQRPGYIYISIPSDDRAGIVDCVFEMKVRDLIKISKEKKLPGCVTSASNVKIVFARLMSNNNSISSSSNMMVKKGVDNKPLGAKVTFEVATPRALIYAGWMTSEDARSCDWVLNQPYELTNIIVDVFEYHFQVKRMIVKFEMRLGHANMRLIQSLASKELVRNLPKFKFDQHLQAHTGHKAKNMVLKTRCLELLHMDLFGPFAIQSYGGNIYTLVIVDDYSRHQPLVDDDLDGKEAIKAAKKKNLENNIEDETLEIDEIVNIKESRNHPLENVIGNFNQRTLRFPSTTNESLSSLVADDAKKWWISEGDGKITTWKELVEKFFCRFYPESYDGEDEMLDEGENWGIGPLEFLSNMNMLFKNHKKVDGRTQKVIFHSWMNGNWNKRYVDNSISSNNESKESKYVNQPNTATYSFFKAYDIHNIKKE
uniref:Retrotransposon protein n=1 Tax=Tanacetum cinerariifolium TaxID=118510 RepID=A0A6L2NGY9_TANCI|nr:retrotransposon protein [Tanacetum cinerariifolium]